MLIKCGFLSNFSCCFLWKYATGKYAEAIFLFYQNNFYDSFKLFLNFFSVVLTKVLIWIFKILSFLFLTNFLISPLYPMGKPKTSITGNWKMSDCRAKRSEIWALGVSIHCIPCIQGPFDS